MKTHLSLRRRSQTPTIQLNTHLCKACWACLDACPRQVLGKIDLPFHKHARIARPEACKGCKLCVKACPNRAIIAIHS